VQIDLIELISAFDVVDVTVTENDGQRLVGYWFYHLADIIAAVARVEQQRLILADNKVEMHAHRVFDTIQPRVDFYGCIL
jgi:hypothetical protein